MGEKIKNNKDSLKRGCLVTGVFFLILLILQRFVQMGLGDDPWYAEESTPLGEYLSFVYRNWTTRLLIEAGTKLLTAAPDWIWRMLNILIVLLLVWIVADLFGIEGGRTKRQAQILFFILMWTVPIMCLMDAGWITTTLCYLWPMTLGLVAARPIRHWANGEHCSAWEYIVCPLCMLYGANAEQGAAMLLGTYLLAGACLLWKKRKPSPFYFVLLFLAAASVVFTLTAPGNANRTTREMELWFPEYASLNLPQKLLMGFIDTASYYFAAGGKGRNNYIFALLAGILLAGIWQKRKEKRFWLKALTALIPFLFCWGIGRIGAFLQLNRGLQSGENLIGLLGLNRWLPIGAGHFGFYGWIPYSMPMVLFQAGVYMGLVICVALTIYFLHGRSCETLFELVILGAGLLSRLILGFSPTLYASGERTALYCSMAVLVVCLRNLQFFWNGHTERWSKVLLAAYIGGVICINLWGGTIRNLLF